MATEEAPNLNQSTVMLALRLGKPGNRRKVPKAYVGPPGSESIVEVDADNEAVSMSKELLASPELKAVNDHDRSFKRWLSLRAFPTTGALRDGVYRLPIKLIEEVEERITAFTDHRQAMVDVFMAVYDQQAFVMAPGRLRSLYEESDYKESKHVKEQFTVEYRYYIFDLPKGVLSKSLMQKERAKARAKARAEITTEAEEIKQAMRQGFEDLLDHAVDRLGQDNNGNKLVFRDSLVTNLTEFFQYFGDRNVVGDTDLSELVTRARRVMTDVTPEALRTNPDVRSKVRGTLNRVKTAMENNLMVKPSRKIIVAPKKEGT